MPVVSSVTSPAMAVDGSPPPTTGCCAYFGVFLAAGVNDQGPLACAEATAVPPGHCFSNVTPTCAPACGRITAIRNGNTITICLTDVACGLEAIIQGVLESGTCGGFPSVPDPSGCLVVTDPDTDPFVAIGVSFGCNC